MPMKLSEIERRVLGCLMEKEMTQPEYYPMTLNALLAACNQKSNRAPVLELDESAVHATLESMRKRGLVSVVLPAPGARTQRYKHEAGAVWTWTPRQRAIMTELLLRGPQTSGELRSRCARMVTFENLEAVNTALESLMTDETPVVERMPREPGRSAVRYRHLLYPEDEIPVDGPASTPPHHTGATWNQEVREDSAVPDATDEISNRFAPMEEKLQWLSDRVDELANRVKSLEDQWNG